MNEKKISIIMCYNNKYYLQESKVYLNELVIPEGFEVDIVEIADAKSMTSGYNEGMRRTDAKFKVYMHQDVFITYKNFLVDLLEIFKKDTQIGLVGMVGTPYLLKSAVMWDGIRFGEFYRLKYSIEKKIIKQFYPMNIGYMEMEAIDGMLMATQYDIPWREDIFKKWDFYDVSQCFEFLRAGYKVVVPGQEQPWYIHDCGVPNLDNYYGERDIFLEHYSEYMASRKEETGQEYLKRVEASVNEGYHGSEEDRATLLQMLEELKKEIEL